MRLLLDTHCLIRALSQPGHLPRFVREAIEDPDNAVYASAASAWEIAIKNALGKLKFPLDKLLPASEQAGIVELPVTIRHAQALAHLPLHHRDPFDRVLIAQAQVEGLALASRDPKVRHYQVTVFWKNN